LAGWLYQIEQHLNGALALVTGRRLASVDRLLDPLRCIGAGAHGAELRVSIAGKATPVIAPLSASLVSRIEAAVSALDGVWVENKTYALAVHFRSNPAHAEACLAATRTAVAGDPQLEIFTGHAVVELRRRGVGKGSAIHFLLQHPTFSGRVPVFVGDDLADEDGFAAVQSVGGFGIKVGPGDTAARYRLADVEAVHGWLCDSLMRLRGTA
jgi:trehalose 6-phosphate phosphatase